MKSSTKKQCRVWWPKPLLSSDPPTPSTPRLFLFGWWFDSPSCSVDVVVAAACPQHQIPPHLIPRSDLLQLLLSTLSDQSYGVESKEILHSIHLKMPIALQESSTFSILGQCTVDSGNRDMRTVCNQTSVSFVNGMQYEGKEENAVGESNNVTTECRKSSNVEASSSEEYCGNCDCVCEELNQSIEPHRDVLIKYGNWIQLLSKFQGTVSKELKWIPEFHHMHQSGHILPICDVHLIIYECPIYGRHHFHLSYWGYSEQTVAPLKKPKWFNDLQQSLLPTNLEMVVLSLNCTSAARVYFGRNFTTTDSESHSNIIPRLVSIIWYMFAASVALISTFTYLGLQFFHRFVSFGSCTFFFILLRKLFAHTWNNVHIRSCQFLYWPIFLLDSGLRVQSNVEYAHRAALRKHFMWSTIAMDVILGILFGVILLINAEAIFFWILFIARYITDNLLRSGCVWLMGVPAGFKLNTELAELLGMVSLNAIQIVSTLGFFVASIFWHIIRALAVSGILFGLTVPASLCIDILRLATLHIWILHCLMSFLYSRQIHALASLWRLFRGRKWNPLRKRLDSYDYCVEQHVVGSLLFTPLLLLLPTTSVFYMFFTILNTTISFICFMIEITISILHATPYAEVLLWLVTRRRFPSGVWIEIMPGQAAFSSSKHGLDRKITSGIPNRDPETVVSLLHSNYATLGQVIAPSYRHLLQRMNPFSGMPSAYGVLSGQRIPATVQVNLPPTLPWMCVSHRQFWWLCLNAVLACRLSQ